MTRNRRPNPSPNQAGFVYLLHFDQPLAHARHYIGWSQDVEARLREHRAGTGGRLLAALRRNGLTWHLVLVLPGTRADERRWKRLRWSTRHCPACGIRNQRRFLGELLGAHLAADAEEQIAVESREADVPTDYEFETIPF